MESSVKFKDGQILKQTFSQSEITSKDTDVLNASKSYTDSLVSSFLSDRGNYNPNLNSNQYPTTGGSGSGGSILKGNIWTISGLLANEHVLIGPTQLVSNGDTVRALVDNPLQLDVNWAISETNFHYTPEDVDNKTDVLTGNETSLVKYFNIKGVYDNFQQKLTSLIFGDFINTLVNTVSGYPNDADELPFRETSSGLAKLSTWLQIKEYLKLFFDTKYVKLIRNVSSFAPVTGVTTETLVGTIVVTPNEITDLRTLKFMTMLQKTGSGTVTFRIRSNNTGTPVLTGTTDLIFIYTTTVGQGFFKGIRDMPIISNLLYFLNISVTTAPDDSIQDATLPSTKAFNVTDTNYFYITIQNSTTAGNTQLRVVEILN